VDAKKQAKVEAKEAKKQAKDEARETKKQARETKKQAKEVARETKKQAKDAKSGEKARAKALKPSKSKPAKAAMPEVELQSSVAAKAEKEGLTEKLTKLVGRQDIIESKKSQASVLKALQESGGLIHAARRALLGA